MKMYQDHEHRVNLHKPIKILYIDKSHNLAGAEICLKELITHVPSGRIEALVCFDMPRVHHAFFNENNIKIIYIVIKHNIIFSY